MNLAFSCCCSGRDVTGTGTGNGTKQLHFSRTEKKANKTVQKNSV
jgi:hypothetical protein